MADRREDLSHGEWREVKSEIVERIADTDRKLGGLPDERKIDTWLEQEQIMQRLERNHETDRAKDIVRSPGTDPWARPNDGEITGMGRKRGVNRGEHELRMQAADDALIRRIQGVGESPQTRAVRQVFRGLMRLPEWRARIERLVYAHTGIDEVTGRPRLSPRGAVEMVRIYEQAIKQFGDPLKPRERKIISTAR